MVMLKEPEFDVKKAAAWDFKFSAAFIYPCSVCHSIMFPIALTCFIFSLLSFYH